MVFYDNGYNVGQGNWGRRNLWVSLWDGASWDDTGGVPYGDAANLTTAQWGMVDYDNQAFDAAYEPLSGRLLLVSGYPTLGNFYYWLWDGSFWKYSAIQNFTTFSGFNQIFRWVRLVPIPGTNKIAFSRDGLDTQRRQGRHRVGHLGRRHQYLGQHGLVLGRWGQLDCGGRHLDGGGAWRDERRRHRHRLRDWPVRLQRIFRRSTQTWTVGGPDRQPRRRQQPLLAQAQGRAGRRPDPGDRYPDRCDLRHPVRRQHPDVAGRRSPAARHDGLRGHHAEPAIRRPLGPERRHDELPGRVLGRRGPALPPLDGRGEQLGSPSRTVNASYLAYWVQLDAQPDNLVHLAIADSNDRLNTWTWNGTAWTYKNQVSTALEYEDSTPLVRPIEPIAITATPALGSLGGTPTTYYRSIGTAADYQNVGSITVTSGSKSVTGTGTGWKTANRGPGDRLTVGGNHYVISLVNSDTTLTLAAAATASTTTSTYTIARQFTTLQAWEDCVSFTVACPYFAVSSSSLVADNRSEIGYAYKDSVLTFATSGTPALLIDGSTTDATHSITLTAPNGNRHYGKERTLGSNAATLDNGNVTTGTPRLRSRSRTTTSRSSGWRSAAGEGRPRPASRCRTSPPGPARPEPAASPSGTTWSTAWAGTASTSGTGTR